MLTCCQPWAGVLDGKPCPSSFPWWRPRSGNRTPNFPPSSFSSHSHHLPPPPPRPTAALLRTQEIPEPAAGDASSSRSAASGDRAGLRRPGALGSAAAKGGHEAPVARLLPASLSLSESVAIAPRLPMSKHFFPFCSRTSPGPLSPVLSSRPCRPSAPFSAPLPLQTGARGLGSGG